MNMDQALHSFVIESTDLLQEMESMLVGLNTAGNLVEAVNSVFRVAHTIKGSSGLFGLDHIVDFTHIVESVLNNLRVNPAALDEELVSLLLECKDYIGHMIDGVGTGAANAPEQKSIEQNLVLRLSAHLGGAQRKADATGAAPNAGASEQDKADAGKWHISVHFGRDALRNGMDPLSFLRYLTTLGQVARIATIMKEMPVSGSMDPESCYLGYEIDFVSAADRRTIENVFEFARDDCVLQVVPPHTVKVVCDDAPIAASAIMASAPSAVFAPAREAQDSGPKSKQSQTIRVDADKLDHLINLIGELVIAGAGMEAGTRAAAIGSLVESSVTLTRLVEEVRESALNLRMVQIGETFNRFQRVVRDVSRELGKDIELVINGGETELDKTLIERISDPLMHLVRNSIDHGIEAPELRAARGKSVTGKVRLNAYHESGSVVIEVSDDGGGLNRERILDKARGKGLVAEGATPSDAEIDKLIFEAGFSTAEAVSAISGRGVGMDVVRRNIEALRGTIDILSVPLAGTTMRIRLPLTMAIIDGFMMRVGGASYVVPLDIVEECLELRADAVDADGCNYINLRGEVLPFIRLGQHFQQKLARGKRENIVVVKYGSVKAGFVVDELMGEFQTVIKPLGSLFDRLAGISGSTILGSGEVALILDAPALIQHAIHRDGKTVAAHAQPVTLH
jgi:two-component system chemotaxis sensor kinase CheA